MNVPWLATRRYLTRAAFVIVLGILLYAGLRVHPIPHVFHEEDKFNHFIGFAALAVSTRLAFPRHRGWWQVAGALLLGVAIELLQSLGPARTASIWDFLADATGVALGWALLRLPILRRWRREQGAA